MCKANRKPIKAQGIILPQDWLEAVLTTASGSLVSVMSSFFIATEMLTLVLFTVAFLGLGTVVLFLGLHCYLSFSKCAATKYQST
jgi:hypothetical protein